MIGVAHSLIDKYYTQAIKTLPPQHLPPLQSGQQFIVNSGVALGELQGAGGIGSEQSAAFQ